MYKINVCLFFYLLSHGCMPAKKEICFKEYMNGNKFKYVSDPFLNDFFTIKDTVQVEYSKGIVYAKSKIIWTNCNNYILIVENVNYSKGLAIGDSLYVNLISLKKDTLTYLASAYGQTHRFKAVKFN